MRDVAPRRKQSVNRTRVELEQNAEKDLTRLTVSAHQDSTEIHTFNALTLTSALAWLVARVLCASIRPEATIAVASPDTTEIPFPCAPRFSKITVMIQLVALAIIKLIVPWAMPAMGADARICVIVSSVAHEQLVTLEHACVLPGTLETQRT